MPSLEGKLCSRPAAIVVKKIKKFNYEADLKLKIETPNSKVEEANQAQEKEKIP